MTKLILLAALLLIHSPVLAANQLTLHFIPSPKGIDWTTPQSLAKSTLKNQLARSPGGDLHSIGHVYEEVECGDYHRFLGMTSTGNNQERNAIFKEKVGLGVVLKKYIGRFNTNAEAMDDLSRMQKKGRTRFLTFKVSEETCQRMMDYIDEYQARKLDQIYAGLDSHPLYGQGSGCTAFGASFLEISGLQIPEFEKLWMRHYIVPYQYIGGKLTGKKVGFLKIYFANQARWGFYPSDGVQIDFWDPDLMHSWVGNAITSIEKDPYRTFPWPGTVASKVKSRGIIFDATGIPTPSGPIFKY